jgi:hypothetical protein
MEVWILTRFLPKRYYYCGMRGLKKKMEMAAAWADGFFVKSRQFRLSVKACLFPDKIVYKVRHGALTAPGSRVFPES